MGQRTKKETKQDMPILLCTLDTETRGMFGQVFRVGFFDGTEYTVANTYKEIHEILIELAKRKTLHVYVHNLDFDLAKFIRDVFPEANLDECIFINNRIATFSYNNIILHDSLQLLPSSLDQLCKDFGLGEEEGKMNLDEHIQQNGFAIYNEDGTYNSVLSKGNYFEKVDPEEETLNVYLEFDCRALHTILYKTIAIAQLPLHEFVLCPTTASLAMRVFKTKWEQDYKTICSSSYKGQFGEYAELFVRCGYYGGRTEVFQPELLNGFHFDVNSLYPTTMKNNVFPVGFYEFYDLKEKHKSEMRYKWWKQTKQGAGFVWATVHVPEETHIPPLPIKWENKLIFPVGTFHGVWSFHELEMAERYGTEIKEIKQVIFWKKTAPVFKGFVETYMEIKINSQGAKKTFAKLMQNSLYGKFGMKRIRDSFFNLDKKEKMQQKYELGAISKPPIEFYNPQLDKRFIQAETVSQADYIQPHIAAYVTSFARILLYESLKEQEAKGAVAYCDTDSISCAAMFDDDMIDDNEYGKWKLETIIERGIYLQPKLYFEKGKELKKGEWKDVKVVRAKGVPKKVRETFSEETYDTIISAIKNGDNRIQIYGGADIDDKTGKPIKKIYNEKVTGRQKVASAMKNGKDFDFQVELQKGLNLLNRQKRVMDFANNTTSPHIMNETGYTE